MKGEEKNKIQCNNCGVLDLNCYEQCKETKCIDCFGASMNDCGICDEREARAKGEEKETMNKRIDPVDVKAAVKRGELEAFIQIDYKGEMHIFFKR